MTTNTPEEHNIADQPTAAELYVEREDPSTGQRVSREIAHSLTDCQDLVVQAAAAFPDWADTPVIARAALLIRLAEVLLQKRDELCATMIQEIGTTADWAAHNVEFAVELLRETAAYAEELERVEELPQQSGVSHQVERSPCGVCLGITPWNAPIILGVRAMAAPLLCGNTVLIKGSEVAPRLFRLLADATLEAGFPPGVVRVFINRAQDSERIVEALISSPVIRRVNFTGSTRVGKRVAELCAKYLKRPLLELGGQATMVVLEDADLQAAASAALLGAYLNQGQICMSTERLVVADTIADELIALIEKGRKQLKLGPAEAADTQLGPVISAAAAERLAALISDAVSHGATLVGGGGVRDTFVEPTLLDGVEPPMRLYSEEVFGPILSVTRVGSELEAITVTNDSEYGLTTAVFSGDSERARRLARRLHSGICHINRATVNDNPHAPFGGVKSSGYGRFGGRWALNEFTEIRWISELD